MKARPRPEANSCRFQSTSLQFTRSIACSRWLILLLLITSSFFDAYAQENRRSIVGKEVVAALQNGEEVPVIIALAEPASMRSTSFNLPILKNEVRVSQEEVLNNLGSSNFRLRHQYQAVPALSGYLLSTEGLDNLLTNSLVIRVDVDPGGQGSLEDSVPLIGAHTFHDANVLGDGIVVAVLDSGIDSDHPDLADALIHEECFLDFDGLINGVGACPNGSDRQSGPGAAEDDHGHGTHVTGIVTANGSVSGVGVAPNANIVSVKVLNANNSFAYFSEIVAGLDFILANPQLGIQVINMSLGTFATFPGECDEAASFTIAGAAAINALRASGVTSFASAGNSGLGAEMSAPACIANTISVGATDDNDGVASFSNSNETTDIFAPGVAIIAPWPGGGTATLSGTSMASPHAVGCAALLIQSGEAATPDELEARLETSPIMVTDPTNGLSFPRIDCTMNTIGGTMHIENITISLKRRRNVRLGRAEATFLIVDDTGAPVNGAVVYGTFSGHVTGSASSLTNPNGEAVLFSESIISRPVDINICATFVDHPTLTYAPTQNTDPGYDCNGASSPPAASPDLSAPTEKAEVPEAFELGQNYPNPFNPVTVIPYGMPESSSISIRVYNMLGQEVVTLVDGVQSAGSHSVSFDASALSGGVYLYVFETDGLRISRRLTLLK